MPPTAPAAGGDGGVQEETAQPRAATVRKRRRGIVLDVHRTGRHRLARADPRRRSGRARRDLLDIALDEHLGRRRSRRAVALGEHVGRVRLRRAARLRVDAGPRRRGCDGHGPAPAGELAGRNGGADTAAAHLPERSRDGHGEGQAGSAATDLAGPAHVPAEPRPAVAAPIAGPVDGSCLADRTQRGSEHG